MKIILQDDTEAFTPITLTIVIESRKEAQTLYELGNYGHRIETFMGESYRPHLPYDEVLTHFYNELKEQF